VLQIKPTNSGGNLLLSLDTTSMPIFIPSSVGAREIESKVHIGDLVRVSGRVSVFQGKKELKISRAADVQLI
jgi:DNA/RNA endonuclease YhcR with UshA esterase domain